MERVIVKTPIMLWTSDNSFTQKLATVKTFYGMSLEDARKLKELNDIKRNDLVIEHVLVTQL